MSTPDSNETDEAANIRLQAADWCLRMQGSPLSAQNSDEFERWLARSDLHRRSFARARATWVALGVIADDPALKEVRQTALKARGPRVEAPALSRIAAVVAVCVMSGAAAIWLVTAKPNAPPAARQPVAAVSANPADVRALDANPAGGGRSASTYQAAAGERVAVVLADGSGVRMTGPARIRVSYTASERLMDVQTGEAVFEVAKDRQRPFAVEAGDRRIVAHGTVFRVRVEARKLDIALLEGSIEVSRAASAATGRPGRESAWLKPGQELKAEIDGPAAIGTASPAADEGQPAKLIFEDSTLKRAVAEANRYGQQRIRLGDEAMGRLRVSGVFAAGQQKSIAEAFGEIYGLEVKPINGDTVLLRR